tara:strand:- start:15056 stop:15247 length:192 start_codon:yes stop_codon:yes gene_type:complete
MPQDSNKSRQQVDTLQIPKTIPVIDRAKILRDLMENESGDGTKIPLYTAVFRAVNEAIEKRQE